MQQLARHRCEPAQKCALLMPFKRRITQPVMATQLMYWPLGARAASWSAAACPPKLCDGGPSAAFRGPTSEPPLCIGPIHPRFFPEHSPPGGWDLLRNRGAHPLPAIASAKEGPRVLRRTPPSAATSASARAVRRRFLPARSLPSWLPGFRFLAFSLSAVHQLCQRSIRPVGSAFRSPPPGPDSLARGYNLVNR